MTDNMRWQKDAVTESSGEGAARSDKQYVHE